MVLYRFFYLSCFVHADPGPMYAFIICEFGFPALVTHSIFNLEEHLASVDINLLYQSKDGYWCISIQIDSLQ